MSDSSRLDPGEDFPEDLTAIDRDDLDILNSRNHRSRDRQYVSDGGTDPETEGQHYELQEELDRRHVLRDAPSTAGTAGSGDEAREG